MTNWMDIVRTIIELVLGGGLVVSLATLKANRRKATAEADQADMDLSKNYVDEFRENIVLPLQKEVKGLRRDVKNLRNAVSKVSNCAHADSCPVHDELQKQQRSEQADTTATGAQAG